MFYRIETYINDEKFVIQEKTALELSVGPGGMPKIVGRKFVSGGVLELRLPTGQLAQASFEFEIPARNIAEAFELFPETLAAAKEKTEAEVRAKIIEQQLLSPGARPSAVPNLRV